MIEINQYIFLFLERPYNTLNDIYQALLKRDVEAALIDSYVLGSRKDLFDKIGVRINKIYDYSSAYGVVLAGEAMKMRKCFREYVNENRKDIFQIVEENINTIEVCCYNLFMVITKLIKL